MQVLTCADFYCILIFVLRQIDKVSSFICFGFVYPMNASWENTFTDQSASLRSRRRKG